MPKEKTGSIRTRKDGKIYAVVTYIDKYGKRKYKEKLVPTESAAHRQIRKMLNQIDDDGGDSLAPKRKTFQELAEKYKSQVSIAPVMRDGKTIRGLKSFKIVNRYVDFWVGIFGNLRLDKLSLSLIEEAKNERLDDPVEQEINVRVPNKDGGRKKWKIEKQTVTRSRKVASVNRELCTLRAMLNYAVELRWINKNPFSDAKGKKLISIGDEVQRDRILSRQEEIRLTKAIDETGSKYLKACYLLAVDCGLRKGEIMKLKWIDLDLSDNQGILTVQAENSKTERKRKVFLSERLIVELKKLKESIYTGERIIEIVEFKRGWQSALNRAGISDLRFHDLRHDHGTKAAAAGVPLNEVQAQLGHADLRTTSRYLNRNFESARAYAEVTNRRNKEIELEIEKLKASEGDKS